jgi:SAM-dependent methyltransferase
VKLGGLFARGPLLPWTDGGKIPWHDRDFSTRMLSEHLDQRHDAASRRLERIESQLTWLHEQVCRGNPTRVLDLGCGPGLYTSALARRGYECTGIDFSPASIEYAREQAAQQALACEYRLADLRDGDFGEGYELGLLLFGELNAFQRDEARGILGAAHAALENGTLVLEAHDFAAIEARGRAAPHWYTAESGLFGDAPHLVLVESSWHPDLAASVRRYLVVTESGEVESYSETLQAWREDEYDELLAEAGFADVRRFASLEGGQERADDGLFVLVAGSR